MKYTKESTNKELLEVPITVTAGPSRRVHRNRGNVKYIGSMRIGLHAHDVPHGLRLAGILTGYRQGGTYGECLLSLFSWHNQTLNSWTMILGKSTFLLSACPSSLLAVALPGMHIRREIIRCTAVFIN